MNFQVENLIKEIKNSIFNVIGSSPASIHEPSLDETDKNEVKKVINSNFVSSTGKIVEQFENQICAFTGAKYSVAVINGTSALHLALLSIGTNVEDEILIPSLTFVATGNAVKYCFANPHFVESEEKTLGIDCQKLLEYLKKIAIKKKNITYNKYTGKRIRGLIAVHVLGNIGNIEILQEISKLYNLFIIEDSAEALGSWKNNKHAGLFGDVACLSFNGNKIITTGGGGMIITNSEIIAKKAKHLSTTAKLHHEFDYNHDMLGYNYRMPAINAALGISQISKIESILKSKLNLHNQYSKSFANVNGITFLEPSFFCNANNWLNAIILDEKYESYRDLIIFELIKVGIGCRPLWKLISELPHFRDCPSMKIVNAKKIVKRVITLPSSSFLTR